MVADVAPTVATGDDGVDPVSHENSPTTFLNIYRFFKRVLLHNVMLGLSQSGPAINSYTSQLFHISPDFTWSRALSRAKPSIKISTAAPAPVPRTEIFHCLVFYAPGYFPHLQALNGGQKKNYPFVIAARARAHTQKKKAIAISVPIATPMYKLPHVHCFPPLN